MPPVQDTYNTRQPLGFVGQKVSGIEYDAETWIAEGGSLAFGQPVSRGTGKRTCIAFAAANAAAFLGIALREVSVRPSAGDLFPVGENVPVLTAGAVFVRVQGAVTAGAQARYDTATGRYTAAAAGGTVVGLPAGWIFDDAAADGGIAPLVRRVGA